MNVVIVEDRLGLRALRVHSGCLAWAQACEDEGRHQREHDDEEAIRRAEAGRADDADPYDPPGHLGGHLEELP